MEERQPHNAFDDDEVGGERLPTVRCAIVGGGVHGVHLAARLLDETSLDRREIVILDPNDRLLASFRRKAYACGMETLLSTYVGAKTSSGRPSIIRTDPRWICSSTTPITSSRPTDSIRFTDSQPSSGSNDESGAGSG